MRPKNTRHLSRRPPVTDSCRPRGRNLTQVDMANTQAKWSHHEEGENQFVLFLNISDVSPQTSHVAAEQSAHKRAEYVLRMSDRYTKDQLVFADETSFNRRVAHRHYGWAAKGRRASKRVLLCRGKRCVTWKPAFQRSIHTAVGTRSSRQ